jgi:hypothetical protein
MGYIWEVGLLFVVGVLDALVAGFVECSVLFVVHA